MATDVNPSHFRSTSSRARSTCISTRCETKWTRRADFIHGPEQTTELPAESEYTSATGFILTLTDGLAPEAGSISMR